MLIGIERSSKDQTADIRLMQDGNWALQFMSNEIFFADPDSVDDSSGGTRLSFDVDADGNGSYETTVWYWGDSNYLYRGTGNNFTRP